MQCGWERLEGGEEEEEEEEDEDEEEKVGHSRQNGE